LLALSVRVKVPFLVPLVVGSKKTLMVQLFPAATLLPHALTTPKSLGLATTLAIVRGALPVLVSITPCGRPDVPTYCVGKLMLDRDKVTTGDGSELPLRATICGLPGPLSEILIDALKVACEDGVKVTKIWHAPPATRDPTQLFV
jgi:hypothetical protein